MTEMQKLDAALTEMGIEHTYDREFQSGKQIVVTKKRRIPVGCDLHAIFLRIR